MKKLFGILLTFTLVLSLVSVISSADTAATQRSVPLIGIVIDDATKTREISADGMGGVSLSGTGGWEAWISYWTDEVAGFAPEAGETLYLVYDITVPSNTNAQFTLDGWNNPISKELAGDAAVLGGGDVYSIPTGTYSGTLMLERSQIGNNGRIGVLGNGIEIRTFALVCTTGTPETPAPAPSKTAAEPSTTQEIEESTSLSSTATVTDGSQTTDLTESTSKNTTASSATSTESEPTVVPSTTSSSKPSSKPTTAPSETPTENPTTAPTTASKTTPSKPSSEPTIIQRGDPTDDGNINMKDVLALRKQLAGLDVTVNMAAADVNGDGNVNMKDVLILRKYLAGIISSLDEEIIDPADTTYAVTVSLGTADSTDAKPGKTVSITADEPADGLAFDKWVSNDVVFEEASSFNTSFVMPNHDVAIEATYKALVAPTQPTDTTEPSQGELTTNELVLINVITNGSNEEDGTAIKDEGDGFVIHQTNPWNVWVLYFNESAPTFDAGAGNAVYLEYDFTLSGDGQLCLNAWNDSIVPAIAAAAGVSTAPAETGAPMLTQGTYKGKIEIDPTLFGETGRLGIVGSGAVIRTFKLVSEKTNGTTTTQAATPYLNYATAEKFGSLGVWWWNANQITNSAQCTQRLDFLQQNHVTEIYLCVGNQSYTQLATFIKDAASRGMRVAWLSGDVSWVHSDSDGFDSVFADFKAYQNQAAANEKFYGIHLDVEPHQERTPDWQGYADLVIRAGKAAHDFGTVIEWDIPFWLDDMTATVDGSSKKLLDILGQNADTLTLMSYRDTASAVLSISAEEIPLGSQYNCKIILGFESNYTAEGPHLSFAEEGKAAMYSVVESVLTSLSDKNLPGGYGCAIHYVDTWLNLKNG